MENFPVHSSERSWRKSIPFALIFAHNEQALINHGNQSLQRLAEQGGCGAQEIYAIIKGIRLRQAFKEVTVIEAQKIIDGWIDDFISIPVSDSEGGVSDMLRHHITQHGLPRGF